MSIISFKNYGISSGFLKNKSELKTLIRFIFKNEGFEFIKILYIFTTDESLLNFNQEFLNHDTYTDILTFTMSEHPISSEIYISIERVRENASKFQVPFLEELNRIMIHGILHLCGYSDNTPYLKAKMRTREDFYLSGQRFT